jgi:RNA polymerase sigma factor (TIGR02999 family)
VDHARAIHAQKRGNAVVRLELKDNIVYSEEKSEEMFALGDALDKLDRFSPRQSRVIELHFFGGLTFDEVGAVLGVSGRTAKREWLAARTWLHGEINGWRDNAGALGQNQ